MIYVFVGAGSLLQNAKDRAKRKKIPPPPRNAGAWMATNGLKYSRGTKNFVSNIPERNPSYHLYRLGQGLRLRLNTGVLRLARHIGIVPTMPKMDNAARIEAWRNTKVGPRVKMAARLYASGAVKSKREASEAVGLDPTYFYQVSRPSVNHPEITSIVGEVDQAIQDKTVALSTVIALAARKAVKRVHELIDSGNEHVALKAAADILDRNPETSKTQKILSTSFSLDGKDAKDLASALVRAAEVQNKFAEIGRGDFVKIQEDTDAKGKLPASAKAAAQAASDEANSEGRKERESSDESEGEVVD